ncbi:alpha-2B adrenergic receptor isoform X1 [Cotesia glomerata]|uniref:alpha-2B adrenergic receptor isoform X1 n=1 Tax=Cotesia glomerata TaxID=32391 RepID=UPI001D021204|nr:alpha-2B adrenergic receptor isoform X1 [Cotesia glomerata]
MTRQSGAIHFRGLTDSTRELTTLVTSYSSLRSISRSISSGSFSTFTSISSSSSSSDPEYGSIDPLDVVLLFDDKVSVNGSESASGGDKVRETFTGIILNGSDYNESVHDLTVNLQDNGLNNWWAMLAVVLVVGTAAGNILVCLAITWEKRLQNVTNYFLMSLAITDLMVAILVMPLGILTLVRGYFPLSPIWCLAWICLDVLFCTASIMHLCTISVDRYLSLRYPMKFGRNKTRKRVVLKIVFVWILSIAMSLPLSLMYSQDDASVLVDGACQIPDPLYKLIGSIICFYIPLGVMLLTYALTVRLLAEQRQNIGGTPGFDRHGTWRPLPTSTGSAGSSGTPQHTSAASTDTEPTTLDTQELWMPESKPPPSAVLALQAFGAEMLKLSKGLEGMGHFAGDQTPIVAPSTSHQHQQISLDRNSFRNGVGERESLASSETGSRASLPQDTESPTPWKQRRRASTYNEAYLQRMESSPKMRKRAFSFHESNLLAKSGGKDPSLPPPCTCPYFGESSKKPPVNSGEVVIVSSDSLKLIAAKNLTVAGKSQRPENNKTFEGSNSVVTWKGNRRGSSIGSTRTVLTSSYPTPLRRAVTMKAHNGATSLSRSSNSSSPCLLRYPGVRTPHSRNSSVMSRNSSNRGNVIRIEQKATKVLGVVFFTFVILWAPFFVLNLVPAICPACEKRIDKKIFDIATWLGYSSSMVNPVFYTIFNNIFRQAFKSVLLCRYRKPAWRPVR